MENSDRRVMYRKATPRPMSASANLYDCFACAPKRASGRWWPDGVLVAKCIRSATYKRRR
jgi:hypothetical protein